MLLSDLSPDTWRALAAVGAAIIVALTGLVGGWLGSRWSRKSLEATFADKDRRDREALEVARHDQLMTAVADYVEVATRHIDLCRSAERIRTGTATALRRRVNNNLKSLLDLEEELRESTSKL